ncbi:hypothetical protein [Secundilactobacillus kimchicus]|uniref:Uncharacterized protein n=1 Tax=Secundilactobacillus kimchicus JCM 15530 TaxID=1302272 RepID=A0A0R1HPP2_9LACO|nr:hypothetical protein [Secundilactobacillus kimchicus]KRK48399.1 hypothetical protein FC96_GL001501 [Secundilactobacillus kimchicus JCM 15530]MBT9671147.1 hypothetical protein [Secundilactobacillus kimchicus]
MARSWKWFSVIGTVLFVVKGIQWSIRYNFWQPIVGFGGLGLVAWGLLAICRYQQPAPPTSRRDEQEALDEEEEMHVIDNTRTNGENDDWFDDYS